MTLKVKVMVYLVQAKITVGYYCVKLFIAKYFVSNKTNIKGMCVW